MDSMTPGQLRVLYNLLYYASFWFPIIALSLPCIWAVVYHSWYYDYRKRKEQERWERLGKFFSENAHKYPDAAASFGMARFFASQSGRDMMHEIKKEEFRRLNS